MSAVLSALIQEGPSCPPLLMIPINACFAVSLDGFIARSPTDTQRFASALDLDRLRFIRSQHQAVIVGGNTFRAWPKARTHPGTQAPLGPHVLVTRQWDALSPELPLFQTWQDSPFPLAVMGAGSAPPNHFLAPHVAVFQVTDVAPLQQWLAEHRVQQATLEGGSQVFRLFEPWLSRLFLTLSPVLLGGKGVPLALGPSWRLTQANMVDQEAFLTYEQRGEQPGRLF